MSYITIKAHDTIEALKEKLKKATDEAYKTRLKAIILATKGKKRYEIVDQLTVNPGSVTTWLHRYNEKGTKGLWVSFQTKAVVQRATQSGIPRFSMR